MGDCMPKEQYDFIKEIEDYIKDTTNYTDAYDFAFGIWQNKEFLKEFLKDK